MTTDDEALWDPAGSPPDPQLADLASRLGALRHLPRDWDVEQVARTLDAPGREHAPHDPGAGDPTPRRAIWSHEAQPWLRILSALAALVLIVVLVRDGLLSGWSAGDGEESPLAGDAGSETGAPGSGPQAAYLVESLAGQPQLLRSGAGHVGERLAARDGDVLVCDDGSRADLHVTGAGRVRLEPGSRLRVEEAPDEGWRLYLERGQLTASIFAAPRLFQVGTPAGLAVDLGCYYTATVDERGATTLSVRGGQVSFEVPGRKVLVPAGAEVVARPGIGPGTPCWADASPEHKQALEQLDLLGRGTRPGQPTEGEPSAGGPSLGAAGAEPVGEGTDGADSCLSERGLAALALLTAPESDSADLVLSLWHLLDHPCAEVAEAAGKALARQCPPPPGPGAAGGVPDAAAREAWRLALEQQGLW